MRAAIWALLLSSVVGGDPEVLVVISAPSVDAGRLADAMRVYLGAFRVEVRTARENAEHNLDLQLAETREIGDSVRAVAAIRVTSAQPDTIDIQLVDRVNDKALLTTIPRPRGDEDLYRSVALKVQALLRSTLAEAPDLVKQRPPLASLLSQPVPSPSEASKASRTLSVAAGYDVSSFPIGGLFHQGLSIATEMTLRDRARWKPHLVLGISLAALRSQQVRRDDVSVVIDAVPVTATLGLRWDGAHIDSLIGVACQLAGLSVTASDADGGPVTVRSLAPGVGFVGEGHLLFGPSSWIYLRGYAVGMLLSERYSARGITVAETSWLHLETSAGIGFTVH